MVYSGSTVCVQALALGIPTIHVRTRFDFDLDALEQVPELRIAATGPEELLEKTQWLLENRKGYIEKHREQWRQTVKEMYGKANEEAYKAFSVGPD